jgi:hypothetical protein
MRTVFAAAVILGLSLTVHAQKQISLLATVTDPGGAPIDTIDPAAVRVTENGTNATVVKVEPLVRTPKVQILIDNGSGIPAEALGDLRKGVTGLLEALPPNIEVTLVTTAPQPRFLERATTDRAKLLKAVDRLAPDTGTGRFVESLFEATERIEKDKEGIYTIITLGTTAGDALFTENDVKRIMQRVGGGRIRVFVALVEGRVGTTLSGGQIQMDLGQGAAQSSGGRFEKISATSRLVTLLPEIGAEVAKTMGGASKQFRITIDRPGGASGELGKLSLGVVGKQVNSVAVDAGRR